MLQGRGCGAAAADTALHRAAVPSPLCCQAVISLVELHNMMRRSALVDNVYEAVAEFFCERRGFSREAALSPTGPVAALLAGARSHLQQPKQLLLGRLAGLAPSGGSGSSRSLQHPAAWQFFVRLLCCLRALQGAGWEPLVKVGGAGCGGAAWVKSAVTSVGSQHLLSTDCCLAPFQPFACRSGWRARRGCHCRCSA